MPNVFSVVDARRNGMTASQLRNPDFGAPFFGTRTAPGVADDLRIRCLALATRMPRGTVFSHTTAALLYGVPLPYRVEFGPMHILSPAPARALRYRGTIGHSALLRPGESYKGGGIPLTSPERTWCDLAALLDYPDLVAAGDYLLCWEKPLTTHAQLSAAVDQYPSRRGSVLLRRALAGVSSRSRSRPESLMRVALVESHLPDPIPNYGVRLPQSRRYVEIDLAYPEFKVGLEYLGDHHRADRGQWRKDVGRGNDAVDDEWSMLYFTGDDLWVLPTVVTRTERRLRARGWVDGR